MTNQEVAKNMIDNLPENMMIPVIQILKNILEISGKNIHSEFIPNQETLEAMEEVEQMIKMGTGQHFVGSAKELFNSFDEEE